jgi:hypothetical protein
MDLLISSSKAFPLRLFCSAEGVERVREPRFPATLLIKIPVPFKFQVRYDGHGQ